MLSEQSHTFSSSERLIPPSQSQPYHPIRPCPVPELDAELRDHGNGHVERSESFGETVPKATLLTG